LRYKLQKNNMPCVTVPKAIAAKTKTAE